MILLWFQMQGFVMPYKSYKCVLFFWYIKCTYTFICTYICEYIYINIFTFIQIHTNISISVGNESVF